MSDTGSTESLSETSDRLRATINSGSGSVDDDGSDHDDERAENASSEREESAAEETPPGNESGEGQESGLAEMASLVTRAETDLEDLLGSLRGDREGTLADAQEDINDLIEVIDEAEDLLSTVDLSALPAAVEWSDLPAAIEVGDIPEAIAEGDASEAIQFRKLLKVVNLRTVLDNVDLRDLRQQKEDVEQAADDVTDDEDEDDESDFLDRFRSDDEDQDDDGSVLDRFTGGDGEDSDGGIGPDITSGDQDENNDGAGNIPSELLQAQIQSKLGDAIDEFRDSAIDARNRLKEMTDRSKEKFEAKTGGTGQPSSRNPTAYSTLPSSPDDRTDLGGVARFSTLSRTPQHSSAPGRDHIYGDRFENRDREGNNE